MASAEPNELLECSVCLSYYTNPVTLQCGHNFCRDCIECVLKTQERTGGYSCPECRTRFTERPSLQKNIALCNIVENFLSTLLDENYSGILCTYCVHFRSPAIKFCLHCDASLCVRHVDVHNTGQEHILTDSTISLENRKCPVHKKILEYYCSDDAACICVSCSLAGEHRGHHVEMLDVASENMKTKLRNDLQELMMQEIKNEKRIESLEERWREGEKEANTETERATALIGDLRKQLEDIENKVLSEIGKKKMDLAHSISDLIPQLAGRKERLAKKMYRITELCIMTDPLEVLQKSGKGGLGDIEDYEDNETRHNPLPVEGDLDAGSISHTLNTSLFELIEVIKGKIYEQKNIAKYSFPQSSPKRQHQIQSTPETTNPLQNYQQLTHQQVDQPKTGYIQGITDLMGGKVILQDVEVENNNPHLSNPDKQRCEPIQQPMELLQNIDILLDTDTAGNNLQLSEDRKTATWSEKWQNRPENPKRFQNTQALGRQGFFSGRHYWEVDVGQSLGCRVGMCYSSVARKGEKSLLGLNNKSWCFEKLKNFSPRKVEYSVFHDGKKINLPGNISRNRFRIYLDYEAGVLSFYELSNPIKLLHSFPATFTEPLHIALWLRDGSIKISGGISGAVRGDQLVNTGGFSLMNWLSILE
ncbi:E3 ubiquitin/ISG15 ligase TRIM25-like [Hyperolius riggenbachi]|uniref:E3 ubiquitin/ISG15 ligase TRIM25-like n=1 Tax=Hyperolius riggenbachi TaxID=752182 RepID=UPI0035A31A25